MTGASLNSSKPMATIPPPERAVIDLTASRSPTPTTTEPGASKPPLQQGNSNGLESVKDARQDCSVNRLLVG